MGLGLGVLLGSALPGVASSAFDVWKMGRESDEAEFNRDWQAQQRATQYQTAVADMRAAGLNPMLAIQQGGAGNLSGATAGVPPGNPISSALQVQNLSKQNQLLDEQTRERAAEADISEHEKGIVANELWKSNAELNNYQKLYDEDKTGKNWLLNSMRESLKGDISSARQVQAAEPEAIASKKFWESIAGDPAKWMQMLRSVLPAVRMGTPSSASQVFRTPYLRGGKSR